VIAEHNDVKLAPLTLNAVSAAKKLGKEISVLVVGEKSENIAKEVCMFGHECILKQFQASQIPDVKSVLFAQNPKLAHQLPGERSYVA